MHFSLQVFNLIHVTEPKLFGTILCVNDYDHR